MQSQLFTKFLHSKEWAKVLALASIVLLLGLFSIHSANKRILPEQAELIQVRGEISNLDNNSGITVFENEKVRLKFPCLCDYGWGYKSFDSAGSIDALAIKTSARELSAWQLSINEKTIFTYEETYLKQVKEKEEHFLFSIYLIIGSLVGLISFSIVILLRRKFPISQIEKEIGTGV